MSNPEWELEVRWWTLWILTYCTWLSEPRCLLRYRLYWRGWSCPFGSRMEVSRFDHCSTLSCWWICNGGQVVLQSEAYARIGQDIWYSILAAAFLNFTHDPSWSWVCSQGRCSLKLVYSSVLQIQKSLPDALCFLSSKYYLSKTCPSCNV